MIKPYDDTWQFYVRQLQFTSRRSDFVPYFINSSLFNFLNETKISDTLSKSVLDIGCGENNLKLFYPNIHGIDRTLEADTYTFIDDTEYLHLPQYDFGVAVNSLHWGDIHNNIKLALTKCQCMWISLNENHPIEEFKNEDTWNQFGDVKYFWHGQKEETREVIRNHLDNDHLYHYQAQQQNRTLDTDTDTVYKNTVEHDPYYGVVRVIIQRKD